MQLVETGEDWQVRIGEEPVFGTDVCGGMNPTLKPTKQRREGQEWFIACASERVVQGTEKTEAYLKRLPRGSVEIRASVERFVRKDALSCRVLLERQTVLRPEPATAVDASEGAADAPAGPLPAGSLDAPPAGGADEPLPDPVLDDGAAAPAPPGGSAPPLSAGERAQIESEIARAVKAAAERADVAPLRIIHENRMSDDFKVLERHYVLDGKPLGEEGGARWGGLKPGGLSQIYDDVASVGVHVLEVEFVYLADGAKLRVKDAVFFDVSADEAARVKIEAYETGHFFTPLEDRPKLRFEVNGKPQR